ncbi:MULTISPECIES: aminotransferase class I/II-fold pyridoxal phosphate-dependent enzyme [unclassified Hydrogenobaculum]|uniref:aminotransferase class I/II-fold pyridoxal phosphate-dependent enzyme n=1 Tax=unclassified Hydrogenobaculum TaxID=2622382 RepID=UPI0001C5105C|nr:MULTISPECIES: aminotransferase class I/II-fold pyridoxal phosphate-dependent enzyme [unclassified Hydrogenobaculum]AEF18925.1 8-amino-7-oxononanoate synthase [Hydrogenobaculum sp. 3684]AEG46212.1 8-amino-7-oxononanoate synthase [Hydrogenobaculum sp. SHO]AGG14857.1 8-amino-7-oxononanoate synthase [Hydrogenobaculum sp. HO]AGH93153.1 7-keto-8-aminopelargonate synthetase-like enzyme [Hydrogenobaculum sp. SN]
MNFEEELEHIKSQKLYRKREAIENKRIFCSNDYLGMSKNKEVIDYVVEKLREVNTIGATASSLVNGYTKYHKELELLLSQLKSKEDCVVFPSGYSTNIGLFQALGNEKDVFYSDELNHASIIDGIRLSKASKYIYQHNNINHLFELLKSTRQKHRRAYIVSDSVFSMEGDLARLKELIDISKEFEAYIVIDEAHATGTIGKGIYNYFGLLPEENVIIMGTLSKAIGSQGGFVCAKRSIVEYIVNKARSYIFSTALGLPMVFASIKALELIEKNLNKYKEELQQRTKFILDMIKEFNFHTKEDFITPIIPIKIGEEDEALKLRNKLLENDVFIQAIRYPTVPRKKAILRLTASLSYSSEDLEILYEAFKSLKN